MNKAAVLAATLLLFLGGCGAPPGGNAAGNGAAAASEAPLAGARIGGPFTLTDEDGKPRKWDDFAGRYRLVYFGYTYCPDVCPVDLQKMMAGLARFEKADPARAARIQPLFITVDPGRDTPAVIKTYTAAFHPRLLGLTGTPEQIAAVARAFVVVYGREGKGAATDYLVSHSRTPFLFAPDGAPIALVPVDEPGTDGDEGSVEAVAAFLGQWVK